MKYDPTRHQRRSTRLRGYDYSREGIYFVTICTHQRISFFGEIADGLMHLSPFGTIVHNEWERLPERWPHVALGAFQVMPNHFHGILSISRPASVRIPLMSIQNDSSTPEDQPGEISFNQLQWSTLPTLGQIIGAYKSIVWTTCMHHHKAHTPDELFDKIWQRSFDDRIIRNPAMLKNVTNYIINNPKNWKSDMFFM